MPHFPVVNENKSTTKIRIVFDASAPFKGTCLNDAIHSGPKLQQDLIDLLIRFRLKAVALTMDIQEMFLQIELEPLARPFHSFLWRDCIQGKEPDIYEFQRLVFGSSASPYLAQLVSQQNALRFIEEYPRAAETVLEATYMDDGLDSVDSAEEGINLYRELKDLWGRAGMGTHKWLTNCPELRNYIPKEEWGTSQDKGGALSKPLGVSWDHKLDVLTFCPERDESECVTKREFLRRMAQVFYPLGFLAPFILEAKLIIQAMWVYKIPWDEPIYGVIQVKMKEWLAGLRYIDTFKIPRYLQSRKNAEQVLHVFSDASEEAFGAVVFLRTAVENDISCNLVVSKARVAPLTALSVPRLELLAALKGCEIAEKVCRATKVNMEEVVFWCDSLDVLGWLSNRSRTFKSFVSHKVGKIQGKTQVDQWRHVPSRQNPANLVTHPMGIPDLVQMDSWFHGPSFLLQSEDTWPKKPQQTEAMSELKNSKKSFMTHCATEISKNPLVVRGEIVDHREDFLWENFNFHSETRGLTRKSSSWTRCLRVRAWIHRFIYNSRNERKKVGELNIDDIYDVRIEIIREAQMEAYRGEYHALSNERPLKNNSKILALSPRLDEDRLLRCDSRISKAEYLPYDTRYPIILPRRHHITALIVEHFHALGDHQGTNFTLARISAKYWIVGAREEIRECERKCIECKRRKAKVATQIMAPLPKKRLAESMRAFSKVGIDYGGPFKVTTGRGRAKQLRYLCLFTCFSTRAVHLEIAYSLDTSSFINAFWRFSNRRGIPEHVTTDNGTQFVGAEKELRNLLGKLDTERIVRETSMKGIRWDFNPPRTPHSGGVFEVMIKAAKRAMKKLLSNADVSDEELATIVTGAEQLINSRPLTYQSANSRDIIPLTPNHFLIGELGREVAPEMEHHSNHPLKRWKRVQEILQHFWKRWVREILPGLNPRCKWKKVERDIQIGDIVLVLTVENDKGKWPLGKVIEVMAGSDGHIRTIKVLVEGKIYVRGINSVSLLVPSEEFNV